MPRPVVLAFVLAAASPVLSDAAIARAFVPPKHPVIAPEKPAAPTWAGRWQTSYGVLVTTVSGDRVTGSYAYGAPPVHGRIVGTAEGITLRFEWIEPSSGGHGRFELADDAASFTGTWGAGDSSSDGGAWNGSRD